MIHLTQVNGNIIDLAISGKFTYHYHKAGSYAKFILDNEINNGEWFDDLLLTIPSDAVIVDVGANVGLFSLYLEKQNRKFYCVEPCPNHILVARDLFDKLGYNAEIYEGVIYNKNGAVSFFEEPQNTTSNRVGEDGRIKVECKTLRNYFEENELEKVDFLKLDCEGSEKQIILEDKTVGEALKKCNLIFIETHTGSIYMTLDERAALIEKVVSFGFTCKNGKRDGSYYFIKNT